MSSLWSSPLPWLPHQRGLAAWAAQRWGWQPGEADWPSALALLVGAEDEGHTALDWSRAPDLWAQKFEALEPRPTFSLPPPETWPASLFDEGWLVFRAEGSRSLVQTARNATLEGSLTAALGALVDPADQPGEGQDEAVARVGRRLLLLVGGPGTGKTTTLKRLVAAWAASRPGLRPVVAAPTGRAAARARESFAGAPVVPECLTLHRLLGLRPGLGQPWHGPHRPLPFDLVIVDEASMLDLRTAVALLGALAPDAALVLVGDPGQLPSVEAGSVLSDLLSHPRWAGSTVRLVQRFRLDAASRALAGVFDLFQTDPGDALPEVVAELRRLGDGTSPDFRWIETAEGEDPGPRALAEWGSVRGLTLADLGQRILLSPVHQGPGGTEALGALADRHLGRSPGTVGDGLPWMIRKNLPHLELHNGDRGLVIRRDGRLWFACPDGERQLPFSLVAEDGGPAWAVTVHKSQGSEFDRVVLVLPSRESPLLVRELVYTGLTRARTSAVLVGSALRVAQALSRTTDRVTGFGFAKPALPG